MFAVGNGGAFGDMCGYNGYVNRIETIAISGVNWNGHVPIYAEACAGITAVSFSRDAFNDLSQVVSEIGHSWTPAYRDLRTYTGFFAATWLFK